MRRRSRSLRASGEHASGDAVRRRRCNATHKIDREAAEPHKQPSNPRQAKKPKAAEPHKQHTQGKQKTPNRHPRGTAGEGREEPVLKRSPRSAIAEAEARGKLRARATPDSASEGREHRAERAGKGAESAEGRGQAAAATSGKERQEAAKLKSRGNADGERNGSEAARGQWLLGQTKTGPRAPRHRKPRGPATSAGGGRNEAATPSRQRPH